MKHYFFLIQKASAAPRETQSIELISPIGSKTIQDLLNSIADFLLVIAIPISVIAALWAGYQMLFAGGDPAKFNQGKQTLTYTVIGLVIIIVSKGLAVLVRSILAGT